MDTAKKGYPCVAPVEGWQFLTDSDEALGIMTRDVPEGTEKRVELTGSRHAIVREMTGEDVKAAKVLCGGNAQLIEDAYVAVCTKVYNADGTEQKFVMEDLGKWKAKDYSRVTTASGSINF